MVSLLKNVLISVKNVASLEYFIVLLKKTFIKFMVFLTLDIFNYFNSLTLAELTIVFSEFACRGYSKKKEKRKKRRGRVMLNLIF